jgi:hypothetical protein
MKKAFEIGFLACCFLVAGCDADRITKLEKENADLKATVEKQNALTAYDLQAKCAKDARTFFSETWGQEKDTILLDFTNHYNGKLNKCFILGEHHFNSHLAGTNGDSWSNMMSLFDVYENSKYAEFGENHYTYFKPQIHNTEEVITCNVAGTKCNGQQEFNELVRPYMND